MSLISAEDLHLHFGKKKIFEGDSVAVEVGDRLGVVGPNGAGKSTLLKILAGFTQPDGGRINRAKGIRVGYLSQEHGAAGDESLLDSVLVTAPGKDDVEAELAEVEASLAQAEDADRQMELSERLAVLHQDLAELDRRFGPHRAKAILSGLGFSEADFDRPVQAFSGGWRMRAALAGLLYQQPDVLLLDEPT
ncbi:MAG: ATP-binding cassette domain-containing protein, partial [Myxococcota bacterium]